MLNREKGVKMAVLPTSPKAGEKVGVAARHGGNEWEFGCTFG
jgi:hypothetical protein